MADFISVAKVGEIPEGEGRAFAVEGRMIAVFLQGGEYLAIDDFCPHMGASLASGSIERDIVTCPWHAWRFCARDGAWCENPRIKVDSFPVQVVGEDIQVSPT